MFSRDRTNRNWMSQGLAVVTTSCETDGLSHRLAVEKGKVFLEYFRFSFDGLLPLAQINIERPIIEFEYLIRFNIEIKVV